MISAGLRSLRMINTVCTTLTSWYPLLFFIIPADQKTFNSVGNCCRQADDIII